MLEGLLEEKRIVGIKRTAEMSVLGEKDENGMLVRPPTFANPGKRGHGRYLINETDGRTEVDIDTRERQNRRAAEVLHEKFAIALPDKRINKGGAGTRGEVRIGELGHRAADAGVRASSFADEARTAFQAVLGGDYSHLARLDPTSLLFGAFDSRDTGAKVTGVYSSRITGHGVTPIQSGTQYRGFIEDKRLAAETYKDREGFATLLTSDKSAAETGLVNQPVPTVENGEVPLGGEHMVGVRVRRIVRTTTLDIVRVRKFDPEWVRQYVFGLGLLCLTAEYDHDLRQGCHLLETSIQTVAVERNGAEAVWECDADELLREVTDLSHKNVPKKGVSCAFDVERAEADMESRKAKKAKKVKKTPGSRDESAK